jgi:hypothetical protein
MLKAMKLSGCREKFLEIAKVDPRPSPNVRIRRGERKLY